VAIASTPVPFVAREIHMINCPSCNLENPDHTQSCGCGYNFDQPAMQECPECKTNSALSARTCPQCGAVLGRDLRRPGGITLIAVIDLVEACAYVFIGLSYARIAVAAAILTYLHIVAAVGLLKMKAYGRKVRLILAWLELPLIPIGTAISVLVMKDLYPKEVALLFSKKSLQQISANDLTQMKQARKALAGPGLWSIGCFLSVVVILFLIQTPAMLNRIQRSKQKETMADIRRTVICVEKYATKNNGYPIANGIENLRLLVQPYCDESISTKDGWNSNFTYRSNGASYTIISLGKDRLPDQGIYKGGTTDFKNDIVFSNGSFVAYPEGLQQP
jgi:hypothetical protein